jgi:glycosyltransferase involved in cell wall biosynthesis
VLARARERPALVHGHFLYEVGVAAVGLARALNLPAVVSVHGTDARWLLDGGVQERHRHSMRQALRSADRVLVVERGLAQRLVAEGVPPERVRLVPMGVDETVFRPFSREQARQRLGVPSEGELVVFVGRPTREKGIDVLDRALANLNVACVAVGPVGRARHIQFTGPAEPEGVALWLAAADVLCLPSYAEGMPVSVVEALACGRPVVASAVGGIREQLGDGASGLLVPPGDPHALSAALRTALSREWDAAALRAASEPFWWSRLAPRFAEIYAELL